MIRLARVAARFTQTELAGLLDPPRSQAFISRLENGGYARLTPKIAEELAATLKVPAVLIFKGREK